MQHDVRPTPPTAPAAPALSGLLCRLAAAHGHEAQFAALAGWLATLTEAGTLVTASGGGLQWATRGATPTVVQDVPPGADDLLLPVVGGETLWFRGLWPSGLAVADVVGALMVAARPQATGEPLAGALSDVALTHLRTNDLLPALVTTLVDVGGFAAAGLFTGADGDAAWTGAMARRGRGDVQRLTAVASPPQQPPYDEWLTDLPGLRPMFGNDLPRVLPVTHAHVRHGVLLLDGGPTDEPTLATAMARIATALDTARTFDSLQQSAMGFKHLYEVARSFSTTLDYHQAVQLIVQRMAASLNLRSCSLFSLNRHGRARLEASTGTALTAGHAVEVALVPAFQEAIATLEPITIGERRADPLGLQRGLVLPLTIRQELIGLIVLGEPVETPDRPLTARERQLAQTIANQGAIAMDNALLYQDMEERVIERTLELRLANTDLQARQRDLEVLTQQLQAMIHSIPDGIIVLDPSRTVRQCNPALAHLMALSGVHLPMPLSRLYDAMALPPDDRRAFAACLDGLTGEQRLTGAHEFTLPTAEGQATFKILTAPVINPNGYVEGQVIVFHDVTRERELDQMKSDFVATVSHELRTPLSAMIGFVTLLEDGVAGPVAPEQCEYFSKILDQGERLIRLIDDLLDFSKLEAGQMPLYKQTLDIGETIADVQAQIMPLVEARRQVLQTDVSPDLPPVDVDPDKLRQVLINLLSNAIKFSPDRQAEPDAPQGRIDIRAWRLNPAEIAVSVADNGIGIAPENLESIFGKFSQVDQSATRKYGGTGLGLPIVRHLVQLHGGRIWADSTLGQGAVFTFTIPVPAA